jgi:RimJ/RimL family protein N-acetyltransferase
MPPRPTARVAFRSWTADDLPLAQALWGDVRVTALIGGPFDDDAVRARLDRERACEAAHGIQYWPIFDAATGAHLGCCGLRPYDAGVLELGVHLRPEASGRGLATDAARAVIAYAFDELGASSLFAGHHPDNAASRALLVKLGFAYQRDELYAPTGRMHPSYILGRARG